MYKIFQHELFLFFSFFQKLLFYLHRTSRTFKLLKTMLLKIIREKLNQ